MAIEFGRRDLSNIVELRSAFPQFEIWWDSLPWDIPAWQGKVEKVLRRSLPKLIDPDAAISPISGVTTNPKLVFNSLMESHADCVRSEWATVSRDRFRNYWSVYKRVFQENASLMKPLWDSRDGREGWICAQVPPSAAFSVDQMVQHGTELAGVAPNVMVKIPGHQHGIEAIEQLTRQGVSINVTLVFTAGQVQACLEAMRRGLSSRRDRKANRQKLVITFMLGRFGDDAELQNQVAARGYRLSTRDLRWIELIALEKVRELFVRSALPVALLVSSLRCDHDEDGNASCLHIERIASTNCIATLPPDILQQIMTIPDLTARARRAAQITPPESIVRLVKEVPAFHDMTEADGLSPKDFVFRPSFLKAFEEAAVAYYRTVDLVELQRGSARSAEIPIEV
jgi:transaldolase